MYKDVTEISVKDKIYRVKKYPESADHTLESLTLIANARELFFSIAEDGIGVPPHLLDPESKQLISDKRAVAKMAIASREELYETSGHNRFAAAKLAGAYVNMIAVLADETLKYHYEGDQEKYRASGHEMGEYYKKVQKLISNINLKGGKTDIDNVLLALLGEVPKAAILPNEKVHEYDYNNIGRAMYQVDILTEWMTSVIKQTPAFASCTTLILQLGEAAKERLNLRREDLSARDASEVEIRKITFELRDAVNAVAKRDKTLHPIAEDLLRTPDVIRDMLRQGAKPVSVSLVIGISQVDMMANMLKKILCTLPFQTQSAKKTLKALQESEKAHLKNMLSYGIAQEYLTADFTHSLTAAEAEAEIHVPSHLSKAQQVVDAYKKGIAIMGHISADLSHSPADIIHAREDATAQINDYIAQYGGLAEQHHRK